MYGTASTAPPRSSTLAISARVLRELLVDEPFHHLGSLDVGVVQEVPVS